MREPKIYRKVADYLMGEIAAGTMKVGDAIYSENELCRKLGVSRTSVRRAIRKMVEDNILESRQGAGTFLRSQTPLQTLCLVNHHTRSLRYTDLDAYYTGIIYGADRRAQEKNCRFEMFSGPIRNAREVGQKLWPLKLDGVLLDGLYQDFFESLDPFRDVAHNCVVVDGNPNETPLVSVTPDLESAYGKLLPDLDPEQGVPLFIYNGNLVRRRWARDCFKASAHRAGWNNAIFADYAENTMPDLLAGLDHGYLIFPRLDELFSKHKIRYIFCGSDRTALKVEEYLAAHHFRVPQDVALCGVGGVAFSAAAPVPVTTLGINTELLASLAVDALTGLLGGKDVPQQVLLPVQVLRRDSM